MTMLCLASYEKGHEFLRECKRQGWTVVLVTAETIRNTARWPAEAIDEIFYGGLAHAGNAQVLADHGGKFNVEVVQRHDAVEDARTRQVAECIPHLRRVPTLAVVGQIVPRSVGLYRDTSSVIAVA